MAAMIRSTLYELATNGKSALLLGNAIARPSTVIFLSRFPVRSKHTDTHPYDGSQDIGMHRKATEKQLLNACLTHTHLENPIFRPCIGRGFDDYFGKMFPPKRDQFLNTNPFFLSKIDPDATLVRASPAYEIKERDDAYEILIRIPEGITASDLKVNIENQGTVLHLMGKHQESNASMCFEQLFNIGIDIDADKMTANLDKNMLMIKASKFGSENEQSIPITQRSVTDEEIVQKSFTDAFDESDFAEMGKKVKN